MIGRRRKARDYLIDMDVEVLDAHETEWGCPACGSDVVRIVYVVTRRRIGSRAASEPVTVNDVLGCADEDFCGWSARAADVLP